MGSDGSFKRTDAVWRNWVKKDSLTFQPEKDRYHLYVAGKYRMCAAKYYDDGREHMTY